MAFVLTPGNVHDCTCLVEVFEAIRVPRRSPGRPRMRPGHLIADKGYSSDKIRTYLHSRRIARVIPERVDPLAIRVRHGHRRCGFDRDIYRRRTLLQSAQTLPRCASDEP
ncbi:transposase [Actinoallomurus sp. CA-150999]|uniref:transposase n=1 Tax=Actinoallomurus sp. CA-150999 TaxID=3239887 RepID=UPI003D8D1A3B